MAKPLRIDFVISDAGSLLLVVPRKLGGLTPAQFAKCWFSDEPETTDNLMKRGVMMALGLYQDDGYMVRVVVGELTEQERDEWTGRVAWKLNIPCGKLMVTGKIADVEDFEYVYEESEPAEQGGDYWDGAIVKVPPGEYAVEILSYPPGDLSSGWGHITDEDFSVKPGLEREAGLDYFRRTRPNEEPPDWLKQGVIPDVYDENSYLNFLIHLSPMPDDFPNEPPFDEWGEMQWEYRKPALCPRGIVVEAAAD